MNGYGFLALSLAIATAGIGLYKLGPLLDRWSVMLKSELARLHAGSGSR